MSKEQFHKATDESIETTREVLKTSLASIERLTKINLDASKKFLQETTKALKEISSIKNPKDLLEKVNQLATHTVESNMSSCRDVYDVINETQTKIRKMLESHIQIAQKNMTSAAENFSKLNPAATSTFSADAIKKWMDNANQTMDTLRKIATNTSDNIIDNKASAATAIKKSGKPVTAAAAKKPAAKAKTSRTKPAARTNTTVKK